MIFFLALRNVFRQKKSTLLLSSLIAFITIIFFLGNSLLNQSDKGLRHTYIDNLTADLMIQKSGDISMSLFGANTPVIEDFFNIPVLPAYRDIVTILETRQGIDFTPIVSSRAVMDIAGERTGVHLLGIDPSGYFEMFSGIVIENGRLLQEGESGVMITRDRADALEKKTGRKLQVGMAVKFTSASRTSFRIREVPLVGIYSYANPGPFMEMIILMDPQTVRSLSSVLNVAAEAVDVGEEEVGLLDDDLDDLFGESFSSTEADEGYDILSQLKSDLDSHVPVAPADNSGGDWNFILLRLNASLSPENVEKELSEILDSYDLSVVDWRTAAGNTALTVLLVRYLFYGGIALVLLAGIISIVNIVLISVFKRTREIGTLRAIGAGDKFILSSLMLENLLISIMAGVLGILLGSLLLSIINHMSISIANPVIRALFGGAAIQVDLDIKAALKGVSLAILLGLVSTIYPGLKAVFINPIEAVRRD